MGSLPGFFLHNQPTNPFWWPPSNTGPWGACSPRLQWSSRSGGWLTTRHPCNWQSPILHRLWDGFKILRPKTDGKRTKFENCTSLGCYMLPRDKEKQTKHDKWFLWSCGSTGSAVGASGTPRPWGGQRYHHPQVKRHCARVWVPGLVVDSAKVPKRRSAKAATWNAEAAKPQSRDAAKECICVATYLSRRGTGAL